MKIYQISKETNKTIREFEDVIEFAENYVLYTQQGCLGKIYANENEYFTDLKDVEDGID